MCEPPGELSRSEAVQIHPRFPAARARASSSDRMCDEIAGAAPTPRVCWGCTKPECADKPFQTCARCREDGLTPPAPFCSKECLRESWPQHKKWHAERKKGGEVDKEKEAASAKEKAAISTLKNVLKEQPASDAKSYMALLMEADEVKLKGAYSKAESLLKKAIDLNPQNPMAYAALGEIMGLTNKPQAAATQYVKAVELFPKKTAGNNPQGKNLWASSMLSAIFWLNVPGGKPEDQPAWFADEDLKELSAQLCEQASQDLRSWQTRAFILCPMPDMPPQWKMPPGGMMRTEAELQEAGRCWQQARARSAPPTPRLPPFPALPFPPGSATGEAARPLPPLGTSRRSVGALNASIHPLSHALRSIAFRTHANLHPPPATRLRIAPVTTLCSSVRSVAQLLALTGAPPVSQVTKMTPGGREEKRPYVARAAHCFRTAQVVAERVAQQAAPEGGDAPAPPDAASTLAASQAKLEKQKSAAQQAAMDKQMAALAAMDLQQQQEVPVW